MTLPDVVWVVRPGDKNEELRYSVRSVIANLPHRKLWIAGYCPKWLDVGHIKVLTKPGGHVSAKANLRAACEHPEVSEEFVYMNDDFFIMQPLKELPVMHRGSLAEVAASDRMASSYQRHIRKTLEVLEKRGIENPLMYDLHGPMTVTKTGMLEVLELCRKVPMLQERTLFGNMQQVGGERHRNHKLWRGSAGWQSWPFLSSNDNTFRIGEIGKLIRSRFTEPSPYEISPPPAIKERSVPAGVTRRTIRRHAPSTIQRIGGRAA